MVRRLSARLFAKRIDAGRRRVRPGQGLPANFV